MKSSLREDAKEFIPASIKATASVALRWGAKPFLPSQNEHVLVQSYQAHLIEMRAEKKANRPAKKAAARSLLRSVTNTEIPSNGSPNDIRQPVTAQQAASSGGDLQSLLSQLIKTSLELKHVLSKQGILESNVEISDGLKVQFKSLPEIHQLIGYLISKVGLTQGGPNPARFESSDDDDDDKSIDGHPIIDTSSDDDTPGPSLRNPS